jgi:hypothetical protein
MASRKRAGRPPAKRRFTTSQIVLYVLSFIIVLSIAIGFVIDALVPARSSGGSVPTPTSIIIPMTPTLATESTITTTLVIEESPAAGTTTPQPGQ